VVTQRWEGHGVFGTIITIYTSIIAANIGILIVVLQDLSKTLLVYSFNDTRYFGSALHDDSSVIETISMGLEEVR
jgi:hypothetical protein